jgi:hypothetical protein
MERLAKSGVSFSTSEDQLGFGQRDGVIVKTVGSIKGVAVLSG